LVEVDRRAAPAAVVDRGERHQPTPHVLGVLPPPELVQLTDPQPDRRILEDDHPPGLPVAPTRGEPGVVEHPVERLVVYRFVGERAGGGRRAHRFVQFHADDASDLRPLAPRYRCIELSTPATRQPDRQLRGATGWAATGWAGPAAGAAPATVAVPRRPGRRGRRWRPGRGGRRTSAGTP